MKAIGLPARVAYACAAFLVSGALIFYSCMHWMPEYSLMYPALDPEGDGYGIFKVSLCAAVSIAVTLSLLLLTLPGIRRRKRRGRGWRLATTGVLVVVASLCFADAGFRVRYDLMFAALLAYMMAFTFVRYGITDEARRSSRSTKEY